VLLRKVGRKARRTVDGGKLVRTHVVTRTIPGGKRARLALRRIGIPHHSSHWWADLDGARPPFSMLAAGHAFDGWWGPKPVRQQGSPLGRGEFKGWRGDSESVWGEGGTGRGRLKIAGRPGGRMDLSTHGRFAGRSRRGKSVAALRCLFFARRARGRSSSWPSASSSTAGGNPLGSGPN